MASQEQVQQMAAALTDLQRQRQEQAAQHAARVTELEQRLAAGAEGLLGGRAQGRLRCRARARDFAPRSGRSAAVTFFSWSWRRRA